MTKKILAISLTAIFAITALAIPLGIAEAAPQERGTMAKVVTGETGFERIMFETMKDLNPGIPFGYGIASDYLFNPLLVITTHAGVLDSETQIDADDASFHSHYVSLIQDIDDSTCAGYEVDYISWQEPADVITRDHVAIMNNIPYEFSANTSTDLNGQVRFVTSENVTSAVTFTINPVDGATCIDNIIHVGKLSITSSDERPISPRVN